MPADTKPIDLAGLRVLLEKMTSRPWCAEREDTDAGEMSVIRPADRFYAVTLFDPSPFPDEQELNRHNAAGIVAIVNAAGALLDRVEALEAGLREACNLAAMCAPVPEHASDCPVSLGWKSLECDCGLKARVTAASIIARLRCLLPPEAPRAGEAE